MNKLSPFVEGMLSVFLLIPGINTIKPNYITPTKITKEPTDELTTHQPFVEVGLLMQQVAKEQHDK